MSYYTEDNARSTVHMGMTLAMILSFARNHSILWAILHGILNWIYVIYWAVTR